MRFRHAPSSGSHSLLSALGYRHGLLAVGLELLPARRNEKRDAAHKKQKG